MTSELVSIGAVAESTGLSISAIRYYDERGLITPTARVGGKRRFDAGTVGRLNFVQRAQDAGFSLDEIGLILDDEAGEWRSLVDAKIIEIIDRRERLDEMLMLLNAVRDCGCEAVADCPRFTSTAD